MEQANGQHAAPAPAHGAVGADPAAIPWPDRDDAASPPEGARPVMPSARELEILRSFARRIPNGDACAHNNLGVVYYRRGFRAEAADQLERALQLDPDLNVARRNLQIIAAPTGYDQQTAFAERADHRAPCAAAVEHGTSEAIHTLIDLLTIEPNHLGALVRLGDLLSEAGRMREAGVLYRRALRVDAECAGAHAGLERLARTAPSRPDGA